MTHSLTIVTQMRKSLTTIITLAAFMAMGTVSAHPQSAGDDPSLDSRAAAENTVAFEADNNNELSDATADDGSATPQNLDSLEVDEVSLDVPLDTSERDLNVEAEPGLPEGSLFGLDLTGVTILDVEPRGPNIAQPKDGRVLLPNQLLFDPEEYNGVVLRLLDKVTTQIATETVLVDSQINFGTLSLSVDACLKNPSTQTPEAAGYFRVIETLGNQAPIPRFSGWMFASSPALNALDHAIYDLWVMDCVMIEIAGDDGDMASTSAEAPADVPILSNQDGPS